MASKDFKQAISIDFAPQASVCEWCSKPADEQLTAIGGIYHNKGGFFCRACGEEFTRLILNSVSTRVAPRAPIESWQNNGSQGEVVGLD
jgi:hypothetical protein